MRSFDCRLCATKRATREGLHNPRNRRGGAALCKQGGHVPLLIDPVGQEVTYIEYLESERPRFSIAKLIFAHTIRFLLIEVEKTLRPCNKELVYP